MKRPTTTSPIRDGHLLVEPAVEVDRAIAIPLVPGVEHIAAGIDRPGGHSVTPRPD